MTNALVAMLYQMSIGTQMVIVMTVVKLIAWIALAVGTKSIILLKINLQIRNYSKKKTLILHHHHLLLLAMDHHVRTNVLVMTLIAMRNAVAVTKTLIKMKKVLVMMTVKLNALIVLAAGMPSYHHHHHVKKNVLVKTLIAMKTAVAVTKSLIKMKMDFVKMTVKLNARIVLAAGLPRCHHHHHHHVKKHVLVMTLIAMRNAVVVTKTLINKKMVLVMMTVKLNALIVLPAGITRNHHHHQLI